MERRLAHVEKILEISPIEGADRIETATVLGWKVVVKKGDFKVGDMCVYVEIDSLLPAWEAFEFMAPRKYRVRTIKLRKQISQGICFPMSILPDDPEGRSESDDVTEDLGITKYERPVKGTQRTWSKRKPKWWEKILRWFGFNPDLSVRPQGFPHYVPKTDEERVQNVPAVLKEIQDVPCYVTVKVDGTSATFSKKGSTYLVCSRNRASSKRERIFENAGSNVYWRIYEKLGIRAILERAGNIAIQGEIAGPGVQKNHLGLKEPTLFVFDVWDIDKQQYFTLDEMETFCLVNHLTMVDLATYTPGWPPSTVDEALEMAKGKYPNGHHREGIVIRACDNRMAKTCGLGRLSFKVVNNDYLLSEDDG